MRITLTTGSTCCQASTRHWHLASRDQDNSIDCIVDSLVTSPGVSDGYLLVVDAQMDTFINI